MEADEVKTFASLAEESLKRNPANYGDKAIRAASQGEMSVSLCPFDH
jgi:hypothetical protein